ncbi:hypothetical protein PT974_02814 [Cladobotryum mycophilum]|uniref:Rhodopsin domain-containing protein n=1 Tax=Cladobotryum mycophilum TaxID=491253 RepID=A0ABR0SZ52_9HYPO
MGPSHHVLESLGHRLSAIRPECSFTDRTEAMASPSSPTPGPLTQIPASNPPPGVVPNFVDPPSSAPVLIAVGTVLLIVMLVFAGIRFYVKVMVQRKVTPDDWTTLAAIIGTLWYYGICIHAVTAAKFGTHMWDISVAHTLSDNFLIASFFTNWPTGLVWALAKTSFFLMYLQIFGPLIWLRISVYIGLFLNWGFYTAIIIASIYYQAPNPGQTWQEGFMNTRYSKSFNMTIPIASGSLFLDTYIFILPLIAVMKVRLSARKKIGVMAVFATGLIACIASSLSIYFKHKLNSRLNDYTFWIYPVLLMALVEMCVGITCACMPSAAGFFKKRASSASSSSGGNVLSMLRSLLRSSRQGSARESLDASWDRKNTHVSSATGDHPDTDIEMGVASTEELRPSTCRKEIHVRREIRVR